MHLDLDGRRGVPVPDIRGVGRQLDRLAGGLYLVLDHQQIALALEALVLDVPNRLRDAGTMLAAGHGAHSLAWLVPGEGATSPGAFLVGALAPGFTGNVARPEGRRGRPEASTQS